MELLVEVVKFELGKKIVSSTSVSDEMKLKTILELHDKLNDNEVMSLYTEGKFPIHKKFDENYLTLLSLQKLIKGNLPSIVSEIGLYETKDLISEIEFLLNNKQYINEVSIKRVSRRSIKAIKSIYNSAQRAVSFIYLKLKKKLPKPVRNLLSRGEFEFSDLLSTIRGLPPVVGGVAAGGTIAIAATPLPFTELIPITIFVIWKQFRMFIISGEKKCRKIEGYKKQNICLKKVQRIAYVRRIKQLMEMRNLCNRTTDVKKCQAQFTEKILNTKKKIIDLDKAIIKLSK